MGEDGISATEPWRSVKDHVPLFRVLRELHSGCRVGVLCAAAPVWEFSLGIVPHNGLCRNSNFLNINQNFSEGWPPLK